MNIHSWLFSVANAGMQKCNCHLLEWAVEQKQQQINFITVLLSVQHLALYRK